MTSPASPSALVGSVTVPGDKSTTQRVLLLAALAEGRTVARGALAAGDTLATAAVVAALGARVSWEPEATLVVDGAVAPLSPGAPLDCRNAGTAARLLLGLLAGHEGEWVVDGDASLRARPMARVVRPLAALGADIEAAGAAGAAAAEARPPDRLPLRVRGRRLRGGRVEVELPSAQVKSALLLAGLRADGPLTVVQRVATRDHTERLLPRFGLRVEVEPGLCRVHPGRPRGAELVVPGDPSSAAFLLVAAILAPGSDVWVRGVGLWPRRLGFLRALERAGADVMLLSRSGSAAAPDPVGDLRAGASALRAFDIAPEDVPDLVDEIPILALAASRAEGTSTFAGLGELRAKESDRVAGVAALLAWLGVRHEVRGDALVIHGAPTWGATARGATGRGAPGRGLAIPPPPTDDHRLEMAGAVAALVDGRPLPPLRAAEISFPGFAAIVQSLRA